MAKRPKHEEHENHERWVLSYADFITLLFALFVVLYASSQVDTNKLAAASESMRWALNFKGEGGITKLSIFKGPPTEGGCVANLGAQAHDLGGAAADGREAEAAHREAAQVVPAEARQVAVHHPRDRGRAGFTFASPPSASSTPPTRRLRPDSLAVLDAIADEIADSGFQIRVEGHTDDEPIRNTRFRNNWDLSATRAVTVVSYLEAAHDIDAKRLSRRRHGVDSAVGVQRHP